MFHSDLHTTHDNNSFHDHTHGLTPVKVTFANNEEGTRQLVFYSSLFNADGFKYAIEAEKVIETLKELGDDENEENYYLGSPEILNQPCKERTLEKLGPWSLILHKDSRGWVNLYLTMGNGFIERCSHRTLARLFPELLSDEDENETMQENYKEAWKPTSQRENDNETSQIVRELLRHKERLLKQLNMQSSELKKELTQESIGWIDELIVQLYERRLLDKQVNSGLEEEANSEAEPYSVPWENSNLGEGDLVKHEGSVGRMVKGTKVDSLLTFIFPLEERLDGDEHWEHLLSNLGEDEKRWLNSQLQAIRSGNRVGMIPQPICSLTGETHRGLVSVFPWDAPRLAIFVYQDEVSDMFGVEFHPHGLDGGWPILETAKKN